MDLEPQTHDPESQTTILLAHSVKTVRFILEIADHDPAPNEADHDTVRDEANHDTIHGEYPRTQYFTIHDADHDIAQDEANQDTAQDEHLTTPCFTTHDVDHAEAQNEADHDTAQDENPIEKAFAVVQDTMRDRTGDHNSPRHSIKPKDYQNPQFTGPYDIGSSNELRQCSKKPVDESVVDAAIMVGSSFVATCIALGAASIADRSCGLWKLRGWMRR